MSDQPAPRVVLCILDGVGYRTGPDRAYGNAVIAAEPAFYDSLFGTYPWTTLVAGGPAVGLPEGQMGNSEVGHLTIGAGRVVDQELVRIGKSINSGEFKGRPAWTDFARRVKDGTGRLHLIGLVSPGGVHSHTDHLVGLVRAARDEGIGEIVIHALMDGRDTDPRGGAGYLRELQAALDRLDAGRIATVTGRYWGMDRDKRWDRVERAWRAIVDGEGAATAPDAVAAAEASYAADVTDEFIEPTTIAGTDGTVRDGDGVFFWNFRADRARELTWAFMQEGFSGFVQRRRPQVAYLCMTPYDETMDLPSLFQPVKVEEGLAEVFAREGIRNLRTAETEKYAHVTYFFNAGREEPWPGEDRRLVPSPKVATYDLQPEMSAPAVAAVVKEACEAGEHDVVVVNFANGDMVGHTGVFTAAVAAIKALDGLLADIMPSSLERGTVWLVTADHGNCDEMLDPEGKVLTQHSLNRVPFVVAGRAYAGRKDVIAAGDFGLADIAPTILKLLGLPQPASMTGRSIIK
ncbi:MAG: 2,3-bisphosphoglycerate-independent phosphoglycerate mutase [Krumholzibacteria bacterium]|nr:2,3-bisphosphoglycerate-independent phosphoglycerate mutase [Candidatus Krumholzibacteria bacterium]